jgi:hypothetical protein
MWIVKTNYKEFFPIYVARDEANEPLFYIEFIGNSYALMETSFFNDETSAYFKESIGYAQECVIVDDPFDEVKFRTLFERDVWIYLNFTPKEKRDDIPKKYVKDAYLMIDQFKNDKKLLLHFFCKEELFHQRHRIKMERIFKTYMNHFGWNVFLQQLPFDLSVISTEQFIASLGHRLKEDSKNEKFQTFKCRVRVGEQTSTYFVSMDGQLFCWMKRND